MDPKRSDDAQPEASIRTPFGTAPRCQAKNRQNAQCARPARRGYPVCSMHGAGTRKRERAGTRQNPKTAPISTGLTAQPATVAEWLGANHKVQVRADNYRRNIAKLRDFEEVLARLWALADFVSEERPTPIQERAPALLAVLLGIVQAVERVSRVEGNIRKAAAVPMLTVRQSRWLVGGLVEILHEFVSVDRLDEAIRHAERLGARVAGALDPLPARTNAG